jgi:REP element-mobilizing transposase RayT
MTTHQQLLYHVVFSTKNRKPYLQNKEFREEVFRYLAGTIEGLGAKSLIVGGYIDHVHLLIRIPTKECVSKLVGQLKSSTSLHINSNSNQILKFGCRMASVYSPSVLRRRILCTTTLPIKRNIIPGDPSRKNIEGCWRKMR